MEDNTFEKIPKQLKYILVNLIDDFSITSWTVQGFSEITSVTIRFKMESATMDQNQEYSTYRRIPPSQIKRDNARLKARQQNSKYESPGCPLSPRIMTEHVNDTVSTIVNIPKQYDQGEQQHIDHLPPPKPPAPPEVPEALDHVDRPVIQSADLEVNDCEHIENCNNSSESAKDSEDNIDMPNVKTYTMNQQCYS